MLLWQHSGLECSQLVDCLPTKVSRDYSTQHHWLSSGGNPAIHRLSMRMRNTLFTKIRFENSRNTKSRLHLSRDYSPHQHHWLSSGGESTHPPSSVRMRMNFERFCWLPKMTKSSNIWSSRGPSKAVVQGVMSTDCGLQFTICTARDVSPKADCNHCLRIGARARDVHICGLARPGHKSCLTTDIIEGWIYSGSSSPDRLNRIST